MIIDILYAFIIIIIRVISLAGKNRF